MFNKEIHKRIYWVLLVVIVLFICILGKIIYIKVFQYNKLNKLAEDLWNRNLPIEADRGRILDRNGVVLADNITTTSLVLVPNQIKDKESTSIKLAEILGCTKEEMDSHVYKKTSIERVHPIGRRLSYETSDKINSLKLDGVYLLKESMRYYPYDTMLSHVVGYVGIDNQGLSGLELKYDDYLTGKAGAIKYTSDGKGNKLQLSEDYEKPQNGLDIQLTIDYRIQKSVERELDNAVSKFNPDNAMAIVMNPKNGEILAMSSRPNFSPSNYKNYTEEEINRNLPIFSTFEPGSTFKIITLAAALQEKLVDLQKDTFYDSGSVQVENARIKCWKAGGHGQQTFLEVVENSCNPGFVEMGQRLGKEKLYDYINKFGFGTKTGIDLNGEGSGILFKLANVGPVELATTSFGQGISTTPIQQITGVSAAINGGSLYTPFVVKNILNSETNTIIKSYSETKKRDVIDKSTSDTVKYALESVVSNGTGRNAYIDSYRVGGKTGTAQKVKDGIYMVGNYIVSFIGFMPADDPEVVVYIAIDNPKGITQYGGTVSAPIARNILQDCISILDIEKRTDFKEKEYMYNDLKYYTVPNVVGYDVKDAKKELSNFLIEYSGSGNKVIEQSPSGGDRLLERSKVRLLLGD